MYAKDYFFETKMFKVTSNLKKDFSVELKKVVIGEKVDIDNLFFVVCDRPLERPLLQFDYCNCFSMFE